VSKTDRFFLNIRAIDRSLFTHANLKRFTFGGAKFSKCDFSDLFKNK